MIHRVSPAAKILTFLILAFWGFAAYSNTFHVPFHFDDYIRIADNKDIQIDKLSFEDLARIFSAERPIALMTFAFNFYFGGLDVTGYHLTNTVIHILTAFGLFLFINRTISIMYEWPEEKRYFASLFASLVWLTNPIQTQAVTYIVQRMASLSAMFYIYALYFYAKGRVCSGRRRYALYFLCASLAVLSFGTKQNTFFFPFFVALYELCIFRRGNLEELRDKSLFVPLLIAGISLPLITYALYPENFSFLFSPYAGMGYVVKERVFTQARVIFMYMSLFFLPLSSRLSIEHNADPSSTLLDPPTTILAVSASVLILTYCVLSVKKRPFQVFFIFWLLGNHAIEALHTGLVAMLEHRMYLPGMGIAAIAGQGAAEIFWNPETRKAVQGRKWLGYSILALMTLLLSVNTYVRNRVWRDPLILWSDAIQKAPYSVNAYTNLGLSLMNADKMKEAADILKKAKSINPREPYVRYHLGVAYFEMKVYDKSIDEFRAVWEMGFDSPVGRQTIDEYFLRMAKSYLGHGSMDIGRELLSEANKFHPENVKVKELLEKVETGKLAVKDLIPEEGGW